MYQSPALPVYQQPPSQIQQLWCVSQVLMNGSQPSFLLNIHGNKTIIFQRVCYGGEAHWYQACPWHEIERHAYSH